MEASGHRRIVVRSDRFRHGRLADLRGHRIALPVADANQVESCHLHMCTINRIRSTNAQDPSSTIDSLGHRGGRCSVNGTDPPIVMSGAIAFVGEGFLDGTLMLSAAVDYEILYRTASTGHLALACSAPAPIHPYFAGHLKSQELFPRSH